MSARVLRRVLTAVTATAVLAGGALPAATSARVSAPPARLLVYAQEWSLWPSRAALPAGTVDVELWNRGQDPHDLRIRALRRGRPAGRIQGVSVTAAGKISQAGWRLAAGRYELYCSLPGHAHRGMHTTLTVR